MLPILVDAVFDDRLFILGMGQRPEDEKNAGEIGKFQNWQFLNPIGYGEKIVDTGRSGLIYGTSFQKTYLRISYQPNFEDEEDVKPEEPDVSLEQQELLAAVDMGEAEFEQEEGAPAEVKEGNVRFLKTFEGPDVDYISTFELWPDLAFNEISKMRYVVHRYEWPMSKLHEMKLGPEGQVVLKNLDKIPPQLAESAGLSDKSERMAMQGIGGRSPAQGNSSLASAQSDQDDPMVEILHYWTPSWQIMVANRGAVIFNGPNPYRKIPFTAFRPMKDTDFFYGISLMEIIRSMVKTANTFLNQHTDAATLALNPMITVKRGSGVNTKTLTTRPGGVIHVTNQDDVKPFQLSDTTGSAFVNIQNILKFAEMAAGITDFTRGEQPETGRFPASAISLLQKASGRRFSLMVKSLYSSIVDVIGQVHFINAKFTVNSQFARFSGLTGTEYPRVDRNMLANTYVDYKPIGKAVNGNPEVILTILKEIDAAWAERPELAGEGRRHLMLTILDMAGLPNINQIIPATPAQPAIPGMPPGMAPGGIPGMIPGMGGPTPGPQSLQDIVMAAMQARAQGGGGPPGATTEILNVPPSVTNPGGNRSIPVPA